MLMTSRLYAINNKQFLLLCFDATSSDLLESHLGVRIMLDIIIWREVMVGTFKLQCTFGTEKLRNFSVPQLNFACNQRLSRVNNFNDLFTSEILESDKKVINISPSTDNVQLISCFFVD